MVYNRHLYTHTYIYFNPPVALLLLPPHRPPTNHSLLSRESMPEHIHRHRCRAPARARVRELIRQPPEVRHAQSVTCHRASHVTRCCCTQARHARECAHEGAAHAEVPQGGDGFERKGRGVDLVIRLSEVRSAAHACTGCHASKCAQQRACRGLSTVHPKPKNPMLTPKTPNLNPYLASPSSPPAAAPGRGSVRPAFTHAAAADTHAHHWTWPSAEPCARCCRRRCTAAQPWHQRWA